MTFERLSREFFDDCCTYALFEAKPLPLNHLNKRQNLPRCGIQAGRLLRLAAYASDRRVTVRREAGRICGQAVDNAAAARRRSTAQRRHVGAANP